MTTTCTPTTRVTRSLLGYGVLAGPLYVLVSLAQALTRDGFDLGRHAWSLLANGDLGWIHTANLILTGAMTIAGAYGLHRAVGGWAPRLLGGYGAGVVAAGVFRADPAFGFPVGTPDTVTGPSWHGIAHLIAAGIGFACLIAACLVLGRRFAAEGRRGWAWFSRVAGIAFLAGFAGVASGNPALVPAFVAAVLLVSGWQAAVSLHFYRRAV